MLTSERCRGASDDDDALAPLLHLWPHILGHRQQPVHVRPHGHVQLLHRDARVGAEHAVAGIVHHRVDVACERSDRAFELGVQDHQKVRELAQLRFDGVQGRVDRRLVSHVRGERVGA